MAKVLLINPSYLRTYGSNQGGIANPVYPVLSLAVLAGVAKAHGHQATILDLSYRSYDPSFLRQTILQEKPDVIGITATTPLANQMRDISFLAKEISSNILVVGGGAHPSSLPYETMHESMLDVVARGEADLTFRDILNGEPLASIPGIYWRNNGEVIANPLRPLLGCLDDLPMPAWELYPLDEYRKRITKIICRRPPMTTIEFSRGCVFKCDFCGSKNTMGLGYRKKSPERCAGEVEYLERLGFREMLLADDIFTSDNRWAMQVCEAIIKRNLKMVWTCTNGIRVDSANDELFRMMRRAGCYRVHFGFESGNDQVLRAFGKGGRASLEQGFAAVKMARRAGLDTWGMFMVGLSADTVQTMDDTIQFARKVPVDVKKLGITVPFPGTPMFNEYRAQSRIKTFDWDDYNVYNESDAIFDHPNLSWETIHQYYKKAYIEIYYKNPIYMCLRFWRAIRTRELFWDIYFAIKFLFVLLKKPKAPPIENYAYRNRWSLLNIPPRDIQVYDPPKAKGDGLAVHVPTMAKVV